MNMEFNKIFAALLLAGIIAMLAGFVSGIAYHPKNLKENAFPIDVPEVQTADGGAAAPAAPEPIEDLIAGADIAHGEKLSKVCAACHTFDAGGAARVGPNLHGIMGAKHAHMGGFAYSDAMKAKAGETWTREAINEFLWNPKKAIPGTKMVYAGMKKPEDRAAMVKYLESLK
jgi:cytochrome c